MEVLRPESIRVAFDDQPLAFDDPGDIPLPPYDPQRVHSLTAELTFAGDLEARAVASFGGGMGDRVDAELTAVPIVAAGPGVEPPPSGVMAGWFRSGGTELEIFTVEKTPAEVLIVVDQRAWRSLWDLGRRRRQGTFYQGLNPSESRLPPGVRKGDRLRLVAVYPEVVRTSGMPRLLFPVSKDLNRKKWKHRGIPENLFRRGMPKKPGSPRLADAVATAGLLAAEGNRPRAVVLIVGENSRDASQLLPGTVRRYLRKLRVPLRIWSTAEPVAGIGWGEPAPITDLRQLGAAVKELRQALDRQHMVWLVGSHLPQEIEIHREGWEIAG